MSRIEIDSAAKNLDAVNDFIAEQLMGYSMKLLIQIDMIIEELYSAYTDGSNHASLSCEVDKDSNILKLVFENEGTPYNPLVEESDTVVSHSAGELGIILTQKLMDSVEYENSGGVNRITVQKKL